MARLIEQYAMLGGTNTAALVGDDGSIDWLCLPRFDSGAVFASLLGDETNGRWRIAPHTRPGEPPATMTRRQYRGGSMILETEFRTASGHVRVVDALVHRDKEHEARGPVLVRQVEGVEGSVDMELDLRLRFDYGHVTPWLVRRGETLVAIAGPDAVAFCHGDVPVEGVGTGRDARTGARFTVHAGQRVPFLLSWHASHEHPRFTHLDTQALLDDTYRWWTEWLSTCTYDGRYDDAVRRSLATLKAMSYGPTGGIVAAPTTSLPEAIGHERNWDYRYCWLRDATITLVALTGAGLQSEAAAWREWLLRAIAGDVNDLQIMYGVAGERRLTEYEVPWLAGYENSRPVRVGNAAAGQLQLDVYGEVLDALSYSRRVDLPHLHASATESWSIQRQMLDFLEGNWQQPDEGLWEVRGGRRQFVHSKVMCWVAFDRMVKATEHAAELGAVGKLMADAPVDRWKAARAAIHAEVLDRGFDGDRGVFTQSYGSKELDAAVLQIPLVGFLPAHDMRVRSTVDVIAKELTSDGFVLRYSTSETATGGDGLTGREGAFLACTFWLAQARVMTGQVEEGREIFERLLDLRNDVGLLAEEYDPVLRRQVGNFPQAFSHVPLVDTALLLDKVDESVPAPAAPRRI